MATNPSWVTLITASLGGLLAGLLTLVSVMITQRHARLRENARWHRECEREQTRWTREDAARSYERTRQRLADSYLEVLRLVEREGQWIDAYITNWNLTAEMGEIHPTRDDIDHAIASSLERVEILKPAITDRATIAAHLAAFGSDNVRKIYQAWRSITAEIEQELISMEYEKESGAIHTVADVALMRRKLQLPEIGARKMLADAIAKELGHR